MNTTVTDRNRLGLTILTSVSILSLAWTVAARRPQAIPTEVTVMRTPDRGIQPQVAVDRQGVLHLIYLKGDPGAGDIYYVRKAPGAREFSKPIRVNSAPGSAIAVGSVRGPHLAVGKGGRVHVAWMGAQPSGPHKVTPMLYTRLNDAGTDFEPQRNVMQFAAGLDGGASVAADNFGNVYVVWHANPENNGEGRRRVWMAHSSDDGKLFAREVAIDPEMGQGTGQELMGACGCCGMRASTDPKGTLYVLYRAATEQIHRDMVLLVSDDRGRHFVADRVAKWELNACPMSTDFIGQAGSSVFIAWETAGQVFYADVAAGTGRVSDAVAAPGAGSERKHPAVAVNSRGDTLLAWTDGTAWQRGGSVAWQVFDRAGHPTEVKGTAPGVPVLGLVAVYARPDDGGFTIIY
jgi:hypothetical protein